MTDTAPHLRALGALISVACAPEWPSIAAICAEAEVHSTALYHALAGRRPLPEDSFDRICRVLGVDAADVRGLDTPHLRGAVERLEREVRALTAAVEREHLSALTSEAARRLTTGQGAGA